MPKRPKIRRTEMAKSEVSTLKVLLKGIPEAIGRNLEGFLLALAGLGLGLVGAFFLGHAMQSTLYGVGKIDLGAFAVVAVVLLISALVACYLPAQRATRIDPMVALRYE